MNSDTINLPMSLALPTTPALRETFDIQSLVNWQSLPAYRTAITALRRAVEQPGVNSAQSVCIRASGEIVLVRCGKRGGIKQLWRFGDPTNPTKTGRASRLLIDNAGGES
jgi:hypothetical protein